MSLDFKYGFDDFFRDETYCDDFTYRNSPAGIRRFPFPFDRDDYMYSVNMEPHVPGRKGSVFEHTLTWMSIISARCATAPGCWPKTRCAANLCHI
jgi:hypothetical protein